jgi:hypothetical protein
MGIEGTAEVCATHSDKLKKYHANAATKIIAEKDLFQKKHM